MTEGWWERREGPEPLCTLDDMLATGATYRQIDYWIRVGYLDVIDGLPGSGHQRMWPPDAVRTVRIMVVLTRAGLVPEVAAAVAAEAVAVGTNTVTLGPGTVDITWTEEHYGDREANDE